MQNKLSGYGPSLIVLATAMLVLFVGPSAIRKLTYEKTQAQVFQASHRLRDDENNILAQINQAYRDIALMVEPSVVHISVRHLVPARRGGMTAAVSSGSGWIYDASGHLVTNYHVIKDAERIEVQLDTGELREAEVVAFDNTTDIAVLKIDAGRLHPAILAKIDEPVKQGDMVFAFGSPFDFRFSMSSGVVSGKGRSVGVIRDNRGRRIGYENFIQVDAAINPGNSGGPLTNHRGELIGMNTAIATGRQSSLEEGQFAGIGLAIPLDMILPAVRQLIEKGFVTKGFLGVNILNLDGRMLQEFRERGFDQQGVVLTRVIEDGPAGRAGLRVWDVVTHVNDRPTHSMTQLQSIVSSIVPGSMVKIRYWRYDADLELGETLAVNVRLDRLDTVATTGALPPDQPLDELRQLGIASMENNSRSLASRFNVEYRAGVMLLEVVPDSQLDRQAKPGWALVSVMDTPVRNIEEFFAVVAKHDLRRGVLLDFIDEEGELRQVIIGPDRP